MELREIVVATTNQGKLREIKKMLEGYGVMIRGLSEFEPIPEAEETGRTFAENARQKAQYYSRRLNRCVLADDSGLEVAALGRAPGIRSARFAGVEGPQRDAANNDRLLKMLEEVDEDERKARFCCALCLSRPEKILLEVQGFLEGRITSTARGENGFGYDPIFFLPDRQKTVAQLDYEEKNAISHRGRALKKLLERLRPMLVG